MATQQTISNQQQGEGWIDALLYPILWVLFRSSKENLLYRFIFKLLVILIFGGIVGAVVLYFFGDFFSGYLFTGFILILAIVMVIMFWAYHQDAQDTRITVEYNQTVPLMCAGKKSGIWLYNGTYEMWPYCSVDLHEAIDLQKQTWIIVVEQKTSQDGEPMYARYIYEYLIDRMRLPIYARSKPEELQQAIEKRFSAEISDRIGVSKYNITDSPLRGNTGWIETEIIGTRDENGAIILEKTDDNGVTTKLSGPDPDVAKFEKRYGILSLSLSKDLLESLRTEKGTATFVEVVDAENRAFAQKKTTNAMETQIHEMTLRTITATNAEGEALLDEAKKVREQMGDANYLALYRKTFEQQTIQWNLLYGKESRQSVLTDGKGNILNVLKQD
jgi:hypothetical protein